MSQICQELHLLFSGLPRHRFPFDPRRIPKDGIYVLFEDGEHGHGADRIVRIGTHTGDDQLRARLQQHFVKENKDRSIFRKNIGRALLARDHDPFLMQWDIDLTTKDARERQAGKIDAARLKDVERRVTAYIQAAFSFVVFRVDDKEQRLQWESGIISTVSLCKECGPSDHWLGRFSPKERIRDSGLWLVNELHKQPLSKEEVVSLERMIH